MSRHCQERQTESQTNAPHVALLEHWIVAVVLQKLAPKEIHVASRRHGLLLDGDSVGDPHLYAQELALPQCRLPVHTLIRRSTHLS